MGCHKCLLYTRILIYLGTILLHGTNILVMTNSFTEEVMKIEDVRNLYRTQFYFLTSWNIGFQILYAGLAAFCDWTALNNTSEKKPALREAVTNFRERVFTVMIWPSTLLISSYFWAIYFYDRNLIYPEYFDVIVGNTSNHIMHSMIVVIVLLEIMLYPRRKPENNVVRLCCVVGLEAVYMSTLFYVYKTTGIWVYPIFGYINNTEYLPLFLVVTALYLTVLYYAQFYASTLVLKCWQKIGQRYCKACQ